MAVGGICRWRRRRPCGPSLAASWPVRWRPPLSSRRRHHGGGPPTGRGCARSGSACSRSTPCASTRTHARTHVQSRLPTVNYHHLSYATGYTRDELAYSVYSRHLFCGGVPPPKNLQFSAMYDNCSRSKGQGHQVTWLISRQKRCNSAVDGHINFKLGGNYRRGGRRVWYTF